MSPLHEATAAAGGGAASLSLRTVARELLRLLVLLPLPLPLADKERCDEEALRRALNSLDSVRRLERAATVLALEVALDCLAQLRMTLPALPNRRWL